MGKKGVIMRKIILTILLTSSINFTYANTNLPLVKVNCDDVKLSINTVMDNKFNFGAYWNDTGVFPNPPKYTEIGDSNISKIKKFRFECPSLQVSYDGNVAEIRTGEHSNFLEKISEHDLEPKLYSVSGYKYPNIQKGFMNSSYSISLKDFLLRTSIYELAEGENFKSDLRKSLSVKKDSIVGYKVDGGELKPLLYDQQISHYKSDLDKAKTIDIYHKISSSNVGVIIQRIFIDKESGILRIYSKSPFPTK